MLFEDIYLFALKNVTPSVSILLQFPAVFIFFHTESHLLAADVRAGILVLKEINTFIPQGCTKLIKSDSIYFKVMVAENFVLLSQEWILL